MSRHLPILSFVVLLLAVLLTGCNTQYAKMKFNSASWKASPADRSKMINDLRFHHLTKGMSKSAIERLLGKPDRTFDASEISGSKKDEKDQWRYTMSLDGHFDCHELIVSFDDKGNYLRNAIFCN